MAIKSLQLRQIDDQWVVSVDTDPELALKLSTKGYTLAKRKKQYHEMGLFLTRQLQTTYRLGNHKSIYKLQEKFLGELRRTADKLSDDSILLSWYFHRTNVLFQQGKLSDAIALAEEGLQTNTVKSTELQRTVLKNLLASLYSQQGDALGALKMLLEDHEVVLAEIESLSLKEHLTKQERIVFYNAVGYESNLAVCYLRIGNIQKSKEHLEFAFRHSQKLPSQQRSQNLLLNLGEVYRREHQIEKAISIFQEVVEQARISQLPLVVYNALYRLGKCFLELGDLEKASLYTQQAKVLSTQLGNALQDVYIDVQIAQIAFEKTHYEIAYQLLTANKDSVASDILVAHELFTLLSLTCSHLGKSDDAYKYLAQSKEIQKQILEQTNQWAIAEVEGEFERKVRKKEIDALNKHNELQQQEIAIQAVQLLKHREFLNELRLQLGSESPEKTVVAVAKRIREELNRNDEWAEFELRFNQTHGDFVYRIKQHFPTLTNTELKICALMRLDLSTKVISSILSVSPRTIEWHRSQIRKKATIGSAEDIVSFLRKKID